MAILQYINNEDYLKAKELYNKNEFKTVILNEEIL